MECEATMQPVRLTSTLYVRVMGYEIGALQHLLRHLFAEYLHRWNEGQSPILVHESIDFRDFLKQSANIIVPLCLSENHLQCANFSDVQDRGYANKRTLDAKVNILIATLA